MKEGSVLYQVVRCLGICLMVLSTTATNQHVEEYPELGTTCHPFPSKNKIFVIGYGSLISASSKSSTSNETSPNIPVKIKGFSRKFNARSFRIGLTPTYLGVDKEANGGELNGVAFLLLGGLEALRKFDKRERSYCREEVKLNQIKILVNESVFKKDVEDLPNPHSDDAQYWIYTVKDGNRNWPSKRYPIVQSYVDVFVTGCLEVGEHYRLNDYADDCVKLTQGFNYSWVNDRIYPRWPWSYQPKADEIDFLLDKHFPGFHDRAYEDGNEHSREKYLSDLSSGGTNKNSFESNLLLVLLVSIFVV